MSSRHLLNSIALLSRDPRDDLSLIARPHCSTYSGGWWGVPIGSIIPSQFSRAWQAGVDGLRLNGRPAAVTSCPCQRRLRPECLAGPGLGDRSEYRVIGISGCWALGRSHSSQVGAAENPAYTISCRRRGRRGSHCD